MATDDSPLVLSYREMFEHMIPGRDGKATGGAESQYWRHTALQMWWNVPETTSETLELNIFISQSTMISRIGLRAISRQ